MKRYTYEGYSLFLHNSGWRDHGKARVWYVLCGGLEDVIFHGADFYAPLHNPEGPESAEALLSFLTLRPGDTDEEYFSGYNERQWEFVENEAEDLYPWLEELNPEEYR